MKIKYFYMIMSMFFCLQLGNLQAGIALRGNLHLADTESRLYGTLEILDFEEEWDKNGVTWNFREVLDTYWLPMDLLDATNNDAMIVYFCWQIQFLVQQYDVESVDLCIHTSNISATSLASIRQLYPLNFLSLNGLDLKDLDYKALEHLDALSDVTAVSINL